MTTETPGALGRYQIQEEIGRGMMGVVYRALDPALGRTVALKTVSLAFAFSGADRGSFEKRFMAEARVAAALSHPGIVVVHDVGRDADSDTVYIAFEFLEGRTLADLTETAIPFDWREALRITARVAEALHHAHSQGVIHRDIKPANIMIQLSGEPKIMDFGIAKIPAAQLTGAGEMFGTPSYMSPEQALGESIDGRSDIFSLGAVLYLMLTGKRAFDGPNIPLILSRVTAADPAPPSSLVSKIPPQVDIILARLLAKAPSERYPDGRSLAEDIEDALAGRSPRHAAGAHGLGAEVKKRSLSLPRSGSGRAIDLDETEDLLPDLVRSRRRLLSRLARRVGWRGRLAVLSVLLAGAGIGFALRHPTPPNASPVRPPVHAGVSGSPPPASQAPAHAEPSAVPTAPTAAPTAAAASPPQPSWPPIAVSRLEVVFEHSFKSGTIRLLLDERKVVDEPLSAPVVKKIGPIQKRKAIFRRRIDLSPGTHTIRVDVQSEGFNVSRRIRGEFLAGGTRRLKIDKTGIPRVHEDLALDWF